MFYDTFVFLCKQKGLSPSRAATEAKISKSLVTKWKTNGTDVPSPEVLKKLSSFFGVTPDYLLGYDTQSQIDKLSQQIIQLREELRTASEDRKEDLEYSLFVLTESYEDLVLAQELSNQGNSMQNKISPSEERLNEREQELIHLFRQHTIEQQNFFLQMMRVAPGKM